MYVIMHELLKSATVVDVGDDGDVYGMGYIYMYLYMYMHVDHSCNAIHLYGNYGGIRLYGVKTSM